MQLLVSLHSTRTILNLLLDYDISERVFPLKFYYSKSWKKETNVESRKCKTIPGLMEGDESFQEAANSVMEAAGAIAGFKIFR